MAKHVDYLIIGQGLAGSLLSWELIKQGCRVHLVDNQTENASQIAAGLINPITGMRLVKSNAVETLLPYAEKTYQELSDFFRQAFYIQNDMQRIIRDHKELTKFQQRLKDESYLKYLEPDIKQTPSFMTAPLGLIQQKQTGYLLTRKLLSCLKHYLQEKNSYQARQFEYQDLHIHNNITWHDIIAKKIIFCEGYQAIYNPWFKYLPFQLAKGEILTLTAKQTIPQNMLNYGHWYIPLGLNEFRTGATFDNTNLNTKPSQQGEKTLLDALSKIIPSLDSAVLTAQHANIRPTTLDKAPFIGQHPEHKNLYIFNGFGAKGSLQIPYYSQHFVQHLLNQQPIASHVNSQRYELSSKIRTHFIH